MGSGKSAPWPPLLDEIRRAVLHVVEGRSGPLPTMTNHFVGKRVLIVEDEHIVALDIASKVTTRGGVVIGPVGTVDGALKAIKNSDVDGAIVDINLRGTLGFEVADALADRHIPFVFVTGYDAGAVPARHAEVIRVEKPVTPDFVCRALKAALAARSIHLVT
jgi:two-component SAPR family response regulator